MGNRMIFLSEETWLSLSINHFLCDLFVSLLRLPPVPRNYIREFEKRNEIEPKWSRYEDSFQPSFSKRRE